MPAAGRPDEQGVLPLGDEAGGGEVVDEGAVHLLVEVEVEGVERAVGIAEAGVLVPALEEAILAAEEFVADQGREQVDGREAFGLGLVQPGLENRSHAREAELAERVIEFNEVHGGSPSVRSMRSR